MQSLSVLQLQNMLSAFCSHIITQKQKINSINVFPVPDQDTGSNLASTFEKVKKELQGRKFTSMRSLADVVEKTALYSAQGNSGIIFTGFLAGFFGSIQPWENLDSKAISEGFKKGAQKARLSIENPQDGTILDVMDEAASTMEEMAKNDACTLNELFSKSFERSKEALARTKEKMAVLRESKVVDAGGLAFLIFLGSFTESVTGQKPDIKEEQETVHLKQSSANITSNRYEVVFIVKDSLIEQNGIKEMLAELGDSIDIVSITDSVKVHIHTDKPETVKEIANSLGEVIFLQLSDMKEEKILELIDKVK